MRGQEMQSALYFEVYTVSAQKKIEGPKNGNLTISPLGFEL